MLKIKKIIVICLIIIIILIALLIILLNIQSKENVTNEPISGEHIIEIEESIEPVTYRNDYYAIKACVNKFYQYYIELFTEISIEDEEEDANIIEQRKAQSICDMLDQQYIEKSGINKTNIKTKLKRIEESIVNIKEMQVNQKTENISIYFIKGTLRETKSEKTSDFEIIIKADMLNKAFKVYLDDFISENNIEETVKNIKIEENIEANDINVFGYEVISDEEYVKDIYSQYKNNIVYNRKEAYSCLEEQYKQKRFPTIDEFNKYIANNAKEILMSKIVSYVKESNEKDGGSKYFCIDNNGMYFIFKEKSIMNYTVQLDDYTIETEEYRETYGNVKDKDKGILSVEKFFKMINMQDYKSAYKVLDTNFKQRYFQTQSSFEEYVKDKLFKYNKVNYQTYSNQLEGIHSYKVFLLDATGASQEQREFNIVMKLLEGTDFVMSFEVN